MSNFITEIKINMNTRTKTIVSSNMISGDMFSASNRGSSLTIGYPS